MLPWQSVLVTVLQGRVCCVAAHLVNAALLCLCDHGHTVALAVNDLGLKLARQLLQADVGDRQSRQETPAGGGQDNNGAAREHGA